MAYVYECHVPMRNLWKAVYFAVKMPLSASEVGRIRFWYKDEMYSISTYSNHLQTPLKDIIITRNGTKWPIGRRRLQDFNWDIAGKFYVEAEWAVPYCNPLHAIHPAYKASPSIILKKFTNRTKDFERYCKQWANGRYEKSYDNWCKKHKKEIDEIVSVIKARQKHEK